MSSDSSEEADDQSDRETVDEKDNKRFVYVLFVESPYLWESPPVTCGIQGVFSSWDKAVAAAGRATSFSGGTFDEEIAAKSNKEDYEVCDYRKDPPPRHDPSCNEFFCFDGDVTLIYVGVKGCYEYEAVCVKKIQFQDH